MPELLLRVTAILGDPIGQFLFRKIIGADISFGEMALFLVNPAVRNRFDFVQELLVVQVHKRSALRSALDRLGKTVDQRIVHVAYDFRLELCIHK